MNRSIFNSLRKESFGQFFILNFYKIIVIAISVSCFGCGSKREGAKKELERFGVEYSEKSFLYRLRSGDLILTNLFLSAGMDPNVRFLQKYDSTTQGELNNPTPLMIAAREGHTPVVKTLLQRGADVNAFADNGQTALMYAARYAPVPLIESLISNGANVNAKDADGKTALTFAVLFDRIEIIKTLLDHGADINSKDRFSFTALMQAAIKGKPSVLHVLLDRGADIHARTAEGVTVLMLAAEYNRIEAVKVILENGAETKAQDRKGRSALSIAKEKKFQTLQEILGIQ